MESRSVSAPFPPKRAPFSQSSASFWQESRVPSETAEVPWHEGNQERIELGVESRRSDLKSSQHQLSKVTSRRRQVRILFKPKDQGAEATNRFHKRSGTKWPCRGRMQSSWRYSVSWLRTSLRKKWSSTERTIFVGTFSVGGQKTRSFHTSWHG